MKRFWNENKWGKCSKDRKTKNIFVIQGILLLLLLFSSDIYHHQLWVKYARASEYIHIQKVFSIYTNLWLFVRGALKLFIRWLLHVMFWVPKPYFVHVECWSNKETKETFNDKIKAENYEKKSPIYILHLLSFTLLNIHLSTYSHFPHQVILFTSTIRMKRNWRRITCIWFKCVECRAWSFNNSIMERIFYE